MRKKVLFIIGNLETGGVSKSITSLLNVIDRKRYDVSLMVVNPTGAFKALIPDDIRIITDNRWAALTSGFSGLRLLMAQRQYMLIIGHLLRLCLSRISKAKAGRLLAKLMPRLDEEFDAIIDFNGQHQLYYMVDKLRAVKKITFFHNDYSKWPYYYSADKKYFPKVDRIFSVSGECVDVLKQWFPAQADKIGLMENIVVLPLLDKMADEPVNDNQSDKPVLLTVGHLCEIKGTSWAIHAASILKERGVDIEWWFIGASDNYELYKKLVADLGVADRVRFLGIKVNPYPYIKAASIIVHPSRFEGKSIALDEARLLCKPVVVTNFSTVKDQFTDRFDASICEMTPECIADAITELMRDERLCGTYKSNLRAHRHDNSSEIEKLYQIIDA